MAKKLLDLSLDEVSLVDKGANPGALVTIYKRKESEMTIEELQKRLEVLEAQTKVFKGMTPDQKAAYDAMTPEEKVQFDAMNAEEQTEKLKSCVKKAADGAAEEKAAIEKKLADQTEVLKKAETALEAAKTDIAKRDEEIAKLKGEVETASLIARVQKEFPNMAGTEAEKAAMLKTIEATADEGVKKSLLANMKSAEELAKQASVQKGADKGGDADTSARLDALAKRIATEKKISFEKAYLIAVDSEEGKPLYKALNSGK